MAAPANSEAALKKHNKPRGGFNFATPDTWTKADEGYSFILKTVDFLKLISMKGELDAVKAAVAT